MELDLACSKGCVLDAKLRLTLPAELRHQLEALNCSTVRLVPFDGCVYGFASPSMYRKWTRQFFENGKPDPRNKRDVTLSRVLDGNAVDLDLDSAGRIALGKLRATVRQKYGLIKNVTVVGGGDHFELWDTSIWETKWDAGSDEVDIMDLVYG